MNEQKKLFNNLKELLGGENRQRFIVALGLAAMALILISQFMSGRSDKAAKPSETFDSAAYVKELEGKLCGVIESIEGVGRAKVMITLNSSAETVFATEEKTRTDTVEDTSSGERRKLQESGNTQVNYILVDKGSGQKEPLISTTKEPEIKGVVVVCGGADNKLLTVRITDVVTTALGIGSNKVCVVKGG